ncbi:MAG: DUF1080 domain-containing protein [Verrucomicrobia bacterium]|nr:DUF1080 domain-containing protein [Verrucomicrobiota bacterium]
MNAFSAVPSVALTRRRFLQICCVEAGTFRVALGASRAPGTNQQPVNSIPISPRDEVIRLFTGKDLTGLYGWLKDTNYDDPKKVFSVQDGILRISGEVDGYLATAKGYRDYHLIVEYKWGEKTYGAKTVRNSGILLHAVGPDGNRSPWMASIECQVAQGCVGDFIVIRGKDADGSTIPVTITSDTILGPDKRTRWKKGGQPTVYSGRQFWWSLHDPEFQELIDTRGKHDVESPLGEWTRVECICDGNRITVVVNGTTVNECYDVFPSSGKILLESEGFEILFRKFELYPLNKP